MNNIRLVKIIQTKTGEFTNLPVKYLNTNYNFKKGKNWWEIVIVPFDSSNYNIDETETYKGAIRLILHWKQNGEGVYAALQEAENMLRCFKKGSCFEGVKIIANPYMNSILEEPAELLIPLTINYLLKC